MPLSNEEINNLIDKLRSKYSVYAKKYSPRWFNREGFEERLQMAIENRMDLEGFILAEIKNFEEIRERYDKKKKEMSFSDNVDRIIEENTARITKYPKIEFHPKAGLEIQYFYGAVSDLAANYFPILWIIIQDKELKNTLYQIEETLNKLAIPRGRKHPERVEDHILVLSRESARAIDVEKDNNNYFKESAFILHDIIELCDELMKLRNSEWEIPLRFDGLYVEGERKKNIIENFKDHTSYGAIIKISETASGIIEDFRLGAFKKKFSL